MRRIVTSLALAAVSAGGLVLLRSPGPSRDSFAELREIVAESPDVMDIGLRVEVSSDTTGLRTQAEECFASELPKLFPGTDLTPEKPDVLASVFVDPTREGLTMRVTTSVVGHLASRRLSTLTFAIRNNDMCALTRLVAANIRTQLQVSGVAAATPGPPLPEEGQEI